MTATKIKIPKVDPDKSFRLYIQRGQIVETKKAMRVRLKKQVVEDVLIPEGFEVWIPEGIVECIVNPFSSTPKVAIPGWKLNQVLRTLVIDKLKR